MKIEPVEGIPRWFLWIYHKISRRTCRREGHLITHWRSCDRCGGYLE